MHPQQDLQHSLLRLVNLPNLGLQLLILLLLHLVHLPELCLQLVQLHRQPTEEVGNVVEAGLRHCSVMGVVGNDGEGLLLL